MTLFLKEALLVWVVHHPSFLCPVLLRFELVDGHMQDIDPGLTILAGV